MRKSLKLLPFAVMFALGLAALVPGSAGNPGRPEGAEAALNCSDRHVLIVNIIDVDTGARITTNGSVVHIDPDPRDGVNERTYQDDGANDDTSVTGRIRESSACEITGVGALPHRYRITLLAVTGGCDIVDGFATTTLTTDEVVDLRVDDCGVPVPTKTSTPTATATTVVALPRTMTLTANPGGIGCNGVSIINVVIRDSLGRGVPGINVGVSTTLGVLGAQNVVTDVAGSAVVALRAPASGGGTAIISAGGGGVGSTTSVHVACAVLGVTGPSAPPAPAQQPSAPPAPLAQTSPAVIVRAPSAGDGGLLDQDSSANWRLRGGIALIAVSVLGAIAVLRLNATSAAPVSALVSVAPNLAQRGRVDGRAVGTWRRNTGIAVLALSLIGAFVIARRR